MQVPGEMFTLAMEAKTRGRGVVGSTSNILDFIASHVKDALDQPFLEPLQVWLQPFQIRSHIDPSTAGSHSDRA